MSKYIGSKCIVCEKQFIKNDEIVVCPDCGTPYHRNCYFKEGKCINVELHEKNLSWKSLGAENSENESTEIKCSRCGQSNPQNGLFCDKCGNPLNKISQDNAFPQGNIPPFFNMRQNIGDNSQNASKITDIDGIKIKDYNDYIEKNQFYFIPQFIKMSKTKSKFSINLAAMIFPELYFFYRKMYVLGMIFYILRLLIAIPSFIYLSRDGYLANTVIADLFQFNISTMQLNTLLKASNFINYPIMFVSAVFSNWFYFEKLKKDINQIYSDNISDTDRELKIKAKGGVSPRNVFFAAVIPILITIVALFIKMKI